MIKEGWELLIVEKKGRIRVNDEEHFRTLSSFISTGNTEEEEEVEEEEEEEGDDIFFMARQP